MANKKDGYIKVKAEYELVYAEKEPKTSILTNTLEAPLQEVRVFNEDNEWECGWRNMLIFGDNLLALKTLYEDVRQGGPNKYNLRNKIKLIYIDPPFETKSDFMKDKEKAYTDKVAGAKFIEFLRKRIVFLREILADDGSIFVHLDWKKSHYIKAILDEVFGEVNFQNEIIFQNTPGHQLSSTLDNMIANIF
jgi:site-specific DNA-methyltransferase (adenine-specific)/adenine-specific DNA-methyltransferase